ncbi:MAG: hypothetical protein FWG42_10465, partial [Clostridiales bacterium]|nr:hypothetical protein [Clostridiales bacterium]
VQKGRMILIQDMTGGYINISMFKFNLVFSPSATNSLRTLLDDTGCPSTQILDPTNWGVVFNNHSQILNPSPLDELISEKGGGKLIIKKLVLYVQQAVCRRVRQSHSMEAAVRPNLR